MLDDDCQLEAAKMMKLDDNTEPEWSRLKRENNNKKKKEKNMGFRPAVAERLDEAKL